MEYKIEIGMTPHTWDCPNASYYWCVLERTQTGWCNCGHGWATSPTHAWWCANDHYNYINKENTK